MAKPPSDQAEKIVVRLPDGMRDRLAEVAKANNRSVNAEVVARLEASLSDEVSTTVVTVDTRGISEELGIHFENYYKRMREEFSNLIDKHKIKSDG